MKGECKSCERTMQGKKKPISIFWLIITGFIPYGLYRVVFIRRNKCPVCGLKLIK